MLRASIEIDEVEADAVARDQHEAVDAGEAGRRQRRGVMVEPIDVSEEVGRQRAGVRGEERPLKAIDFEWPEAGGREGDLSCGRPKRALDTDRKRSLPVVRHAV